MGDSNPGLDITQFLKGKNIFVTGATGFLGKVLVEKILRAQPDVGQLFLLIKADDLLSAESRLMKEIVDANLFAILKECHGSSYEDFMASKITPVVGNLTLDGLVLAVDESASINLRSKLDVVVNCAASTTFDGRYDHHLNVNTKGAQRILEFSKACPQLQLMMHVSTAFVNGQRTGVIREQAFRMGQSIAKELLGELAVPELNLEGELKVVADVVVQCQTAPDAGTSDLGEAKEKHLSRALKELGLERAKLFGWQDTYAFTKAMGEMMIHSTSGKLPVVIIRPSIIESSIKEPFEGWIEGYRMMDPLILSYGKGQLAGFLMDPKAVLDVVPVDMVANAILAAMARHASKSGLEVYQVGSSGSNPFTIYDFMRITHKHFIEHPLIDIARNLIKVEKWHSYQDMETFMASICNLQQEESHAPQNKLVIKAREKAAHLASIYGFYTFYAGRFDNTNTKNYMRIFHAKIKKYLDLMYKALIGIITLT